jgi:tRNA threonylcarbamoyladenosine biosynthesis protein TsaE
MIEHLSLPHEQATLALGAALGGALPAKELRGLVAHLHGELGAGKTTLVRGLLRGLGHEGRVKSPSYALVEPYGLSKLNLYHFDFYRFKDQSEWLSSGFREHFNPESLCVVEWPERAGSLLGRADLDIRLAYQEPAQGTGRAATLEARGARAQDWLAAGLARWRSSSQQP